MSRISRLFDCLRQDGRSGLIAYITCGDPSLEATPELVAALERGGVDLIELGVPFSDPVADGPVIQRASERALAAGTTLGGVLEVAAGIRRRSQIPILLFTYLNPVLRYGFERLAADAVNSGVDGCLMTDLSVEEAEDYVSVMRRHGLETVFLAAPTSTPDRLRSIARYSSGFIYLVSRTGVTGERSSVSAAVGSLVRSMREITSLGLAVGFGISTREHVAEVGRLADAVVVGSAFVRLIEENVNDPRVAEKLETLTRDLRQGCRTVDR
jgi:tryptophan synthase alpha chain